MPLGSNVADHEIVVVAVRYVELSVSNTPFVGELSWNVLAGVPEQVPFSYRLNSTVPAEA